MEAKKLPTYKEKIITLDTLKTATEKALVAFNKALESVKEEMEAYGRNRTETVENKASKYEKLESLKTMTEETFNNRQLAKCEINAFSAKEKLKIAQGKVENTTGFTGKKYRCFCGLLGSLAKDGVILKHDKESAAKVSFTTKDGLIKAELK